MVSGNLEVMSACSEFTQNAWKKELCINCQRSKGEHSIVNGSGNPHPSKPPVPSKNSPVLAKRNSRVLKNSLFVQDSVDNKENVEFEGQSNVGKETTENDSKKTEKSTRVGFVESTPEIIGYDGGLDNLTSEKDKIADKKLLKVGFVDSDPEIIGYDGGFDNIAVFGDEHEDLSDSDGSIEDLSFTEEEREFVLLAVENTLWNSNLNNLNGKSSFERSTVKSSREFEDVEIFSMLKSNRFSKVTDIDALFHKRQCGTFPLRSKGSASKLSVGGVVFSGSSSDLELPNVDQKISSSDYKSPSSKFMYVSSSSSLSSDSDVKRSSLERTKDRSVNITETGVPYKVVNVVDNEAGEAPELPKKSGEKHLTDDVDSDSLEGFNPQIDLDSSSAGMELVDLLNDVLARYSDGETFRSIEDHELLPEVVNAVSEEIKNQVGPDSQVDSKSLKGTLKSKQFEEKIASLAATLDLSKQKSKKPAPRPPTSPPPEPISPNKKTSPSHNIEPNFKMVPIGKPIIDHTAPTQRKTSSSDAVDEGMEGSKVKVDSKAKKGITSFFRNILRRGRDSVDGSNDSGNLGESSSSLSSDGSGNQSGAVDKKQTDAETSGNKEKASGKSSPQMKNKVLPSFSNRNRTSVIAAFADKSKAEKGSDVSLSEKSENEENVVPVVKQEVEPIKEHEVGKMEDKVASETVTNVQSSTGQTNVVKPPVAARPKPVPPPNKPSISPQGSQKEAGGKSPPVRERNTSTSSVESESKTESPKRSDGDHVVVRRRAKSPKRSAAPSRPHVAPKGPENRHSNFTKELEMRLSKNVDQMKVSPPPAPSGPPPAPSAPPKLAKPDQKKLTAPQPPPSPTSPKETSLPPVTVETKEETADQQTAEKVVEKIELPTTHSRRSFLGKLGKGKSRAAPRPPQNVKRTKSITETSMAGDLQVKKIDASDISGPVLIQEMTTHQVVNRRNTITIGEDCSMISGGSTSSGSTNEKYDEWPEFSPLGSLDNLYEPIVPNEPPPPPPNMQPVMVSSAPSASALMPSEGYLEPVRSNTDTAITTSHATSENYPSSNGHIREDYGDVSEERKKLLASQPIYEEINGEGKELPKDETRCKEKPPLTVDTSLVVCEKDSLPVLDSPSPSQLAFSSESEPSSACSTLNRPKPVPRKRPKKTDSFTSEQPYVAMNRPSIAVALNEPQLRDLLNQLTSMNLQTLREIYTQYEKVFMKDTVNLNVTGAGPLKWHDFDIYGKPVHASERCIVYNAKLKSMSPHCQLLLLHSKPDMMAAQHPGILKPTVIFTDNIPFSFLTEDFIKTSLLLHNLQNSASQSNSAKCYVAVGVFDITDSLTNHISAHNMIDSAKSEGEELIECVLFYMLQILSAISHCLDQGFSLGEANFRDVFVLSNRDTFTGDIVAFLPHQRSPDRSHDTAQVESLCNYLRKYLTDNLAQVSVSENKKYAHGISKVETLFQSQKLESLPLARSYIEFLLWGPIRENWAVGTERQSNLEPKLSMWLEQERTSVVHNLAKMLPGHVLKYSVKEFYHMKFLLKSGAVSLTECVHHHTSAT